MDVINVGNGKYKLVLTGDDLRRYNIFNSQYNIGESIEIKRVLSAVKKEYGIDLLHKKVYAEYYKSKGGGGEIYLRTIDVNNYINSNKYTVIKDKKDKCITNCGFFGLSEVISFCKTLYERGYDGKSVLYSLPWGYFCLEIEAKTPFVGEYGGRVLSDEFYYIMKEYGRKICDNAVSKLKMY